MIRINHTLTSGQIPSLDLFFFRPCSLTLSYDLFISSALLNLSLPFFLVPSPSVFPFLLLHLTLSVILPFYPSVCSLSLLVSCQLAMSNVHLKTTYSFLINYLINIMPNDSVRATKAVPE